MIYLTGDTHPDKLRLVCPRCRVSLLATEISGPKDKYKTYFLACKKTNCRHLGINVIRYSWPLPPMYFDEPNFWCQAEKDPGANFHPETVIRKPDAGNEPDTEGTRPSEASHSSNAPIIEEQSKGSTNMTSKSPSLMPQLSQREQMIYSMYAAKRAETPLSIEYSVPVGFEFLQPIAGQKQISEDPPDQRLFRIDVVEHYADRILILEVKTRADLKAYGQLLAYRNLYLMHYQVEVPVIPALVMEDASPITVGVFLDDEIPVFPVSIDTAIN